MIIDVFGAGSKHDQRIEEELPIGGNMRGKPSAAEPLVEPLVELEAETTWELSWEDLSEYSTCFAQVDVLVHQLGAFGREIAAYSR